MSPPPAGAAAFERGRAAYGAGDWAAAAVAFQEAVDVGYDRATVYEALGLARMKGGDLDAARAALAHAEELSPTAGIAYHRGLVELAAERHQAAADAFRRAGERGHDPTEAAIGHAAALAMMGEGAGCREVLDGLPGDQREHPEARYWEAVACAQERAAPGMREWALRSLRELLGRPEGVSDWLRGRAHFLLASLLDDDPEGYQEAIENYLEGLAYDPDFAVGRNNLGAVYLSTDRPEDARRELKAALMTSPGYGRVHGNLARLYYDKLVTEALRQDLVELARVLDPEQMAEATLGLIEALMDESRVRTYHEFYDRGHALKNLLALLGSRIKRLRRRLPEGEDLEQGLDALRDQYEEVFARLAEDLRLARPTTGPGQRMDLNALLRRAARRAEREAGDRVEVRLHLDRTLPALFGDADALLEALVNLVRNAVEAMGGQGILELSSQVGEDARTLALEVRDHGPGLPLDDPEKVFRRGFTTREQGSGLGLALVRRTVRDLRGQVRAWNHPDGGAVFRVELPVAVRYHPSRSLGLAARPVRLEERDELNVDELT